MSNTRLLVDSTGQELKKAPPQIKSVRPFGSTILVEILDAQDALGTKIHMNKDAKVGAPQGYILALGDKLPEDSGVKVGDRVMMQGTFVPVPDFDRHPRMRGIIEMHNIKALFDEADAD